MMGAYFKFCSKNDHQIPSILPSSSYVSMPTDEVVLMLVGLNRTIIIFQMESASSKEGREGGYKIYFPEKTFGKATKNRKEDPNMFELLTWGVDGFEKHCFKKDEKFHHSTDAYLNMIGRAPWTSEAHENYLNYTQHAIDANPDVLHKIDNYIEDRLPRGDKEERRSPKQQQQRSKEKQPERKENKYQSNNYLSPKGVSTKQLQQDATSPKHYRPTSIADANKSTKKMKPSEDRQKMDAVKGQEGRVQQQQEGKGYAMERSREQQKQLTVGQQAKLIQNFKQTTRWIPNSAFTTYFGKPPFENYGRGNTHPIDGGLVYGTYLYSHNVHPHRGKNNPKNVQSYPVALMKAKSQGTLVPTPPRTRPDYSTDLLNANVAEIDHRSKIEPQVNNFAGLDIQVPRLGEMEKFGGKRKGRPATALPEHTHA